MTVWRYEAIVLDVAGAPARPKDAARHRGELAASSEAEARAALRRIGLQAVRVRPSRRERQREAGRSDLVRSLAEAWNRRQRRRRRGVRAQIFDSVATMIRSGVPLLEAVETLAVARSGQSSRRTMLVELREALRSGHSLAAGMRSHPGWFDPVEAAMVDAGQHGGTMPDVLQALSERHEEEGRLANKLASALLYPTIVALAGVGVAIFLSVRTLPELTRILEGSKVPVPAVTIWVMSAGQWLARWGLIAAIALTCAAVLTIPLAARSGRARQWQGRAVPRVVRTMAVAQVATRLGELVRAGVPVTEAIRVLAPTTNPALGAILLEAASRIERGEELGPSLCDGRWFDEEFRRLVDVAQASGELDAMLERVGRRYEREARRLIDRLATLLEPTVIILLAILIGTVVMAAVLPLVRMKDVI